VSFPAPLLPWVEYRFLKVTAAGLVPNDGGFVYFYAAGTSTPQDTFSDSDLVTANPNPIELDTDGRAPDPIFLSPTAYKVEVQDADGVTLYTVDDVSDPAWTALATSGNVQAEGTTATTSPYVVTATDNLIIVSSFTTPFVIQLPAAADRGTPLVIKNISSPVTIRVTPDGADTVESIAAYYEIPPATSPLMPTATFISDGVSAWWITGGIGIT
jgi:hypothetical protein